jgi:hypothetical protein
MSSVCATKEREYQSVRARVIMAIQETIVLGSIGVPLGILRWEKPLLPSLEKTKILKIGPDTIDDEVRTITRYMEWCNLVEDPD